VIFPLYTQEDIDKRESGEHNENEEEKDKGNTENNSESSSSASQSKGSTGGVGYSAIDPITSVVCGTTNTLCITESKRLFAFGGGLYGKNGTGDEKNRKSNQRYCNVGSVSCTAIAPSSWLLLFLFPLRYTTNRGN
jgi:alpha-tubulin suppressor-like RCC1 family protein